MSPSKPRWVMEPFERSHWASNFFFCITSKTVSLWNDHSAISHAPSCICTQTCIHDILHIHVVSHVRVCVHMSEGAIAHGVASINRLVKIIGVFCKRALYKRLYSAKEIYDFKSLLIGAIAYLVSTPWLRWVMRLISATHEEVLHISQKSKYVCVYAHAHMCIYLHMYYVHVYVYIYIYIYIM